MRVVGSVSHSGIGVGIAALVAATLIAPAHLPPRSEAVVPSVALTASPFDPYVDLVTNTFDNLVTIGEHWLDDPLPTAAQLVDNWGDYLQRTVDAIGDTAESVVDGLKNLPGQLESLVDSISSGDIVPALSEAIIMVISAFPVLGLVDRLVAIPIDVIGNIVNAATAVLHALQVPVGLAALSSLQAVIAEVETVGRDFIDDLSAGDIGGALSGLFGAPAEILNAYLNSESPGLAGVLAPFETAEQTGFVDALVNFLPRSVAEAIGADPSPLNDAPPPDVGDVDDPGDPGALLPDL